MSGTEHFKEAVSVRTALKLKEIRILLGHTNNDATRMALTRAHVKADGLDLGTWPPSKIYNADDVWQTFGDKILHHAQGDAEAKELCWTVYDNYIRSAAVLQEARSVFADKLE